VCRNCFSWEKIEAVKNRLKGLSGIKLKTFSLLIITYKTAHHHSSFYPDTYYCYYYRFNTSKCLSKTVCAPHSLRLFPDLVPSYTEIRPLKHYRWRWEDKILRSGGASYLQCSANMANG
jgi:hypothetical protein